MLIWRVLYLSIAGTITTRRSFDRELESFFRLRVAVSGPPSSSAVASLPSNASDVIVYVTDVNDNSPVFEFPSPGNDTVYISDDQRPGSHFAQSSIVWLLLIIAF